ncbi:MAG: hypothetical protein GF344_01020 [Chitinivibrionales bacterium]|nr:hypothetical protein [Chitinivibrionales bacterium]MBD3355686.1 hypothetical protein [Chitinivibrionales bacterium]
MNIPTAIVLLMIASVNVTANCKPCTFLGTDSIPSDNRHIPMPEPLDHHVPSTNIKRIANATLLRRFDLGRGVRLATGNPYKALNTDAMGEVPNSSWFENRNGKKRMTVEEIARGPNSVGGPDTTGTWTIFRAKNEGDSPGFHIIDDRGERYVIKLDPRGFPELASGAEVISTKIMYAAGYRVPENYVTEFDPNIVKLPEKDIMIEGRWGRERPMTAEDLQNVFDLSHAFANGKVRGVASRYIEGKALGGWKLKGTRPDDPNDFIPHEHRREIRGLRVVASWINHYDINYGNTFDTYVTVDGKSYVRHYLIDFGGTLGASTDGPMPRLYGHEYFFDMWRVLTRIATLGAYYPLYERWDTIAYPAAGTWEARTFKPAEYRFLYPSLAFDNLTDGDGYWAARIVMSFSDKQLYAAAAEGQYRDPTVAAHIAEILVRRRDKIGRRYYSQVNPLDEFKLHRLSGGDYELSFKDRAIVDGLEAPEGAMYSYAINLLNGCPICTSAVKTKTRLSLPALEMPSIADTYAIVKIRTVRDGERISPLLCVYLRREVDGSLTLAGLSR